MLGNPKRKLALFVFWETFVFYCAVHQFWYSYVQFQIKTWNFYFFCPFRHSWVLRRREWIFLIKHESLTFFVGSGNFLFPVLFFFIHSLSTEINSWLKNFLYSTVLLGTKKNPDKHSCAYQSVQGMTTIKYTLDFRSAITIIKYLFQSRIYIYTR